MKRIYLLMMLSVAALGNAFAQRSVDLQIEHLILKNGASQFTYIQNGDKIFSNNGPTGPKPVYQFRFLFIVPNTSTDTLTKNDKIMLRWPFSQTVQSLNLWQVNGIGKGDTVWYTTPSAGPAPVTSTASPSSSQNIQFCDSAWAMDTLGTGNVIPDPNVANNERCATVELTIWATYIEEAMVEANTVFLYPNPATDKLNLKYNFTKPASKALVTVTNTTGQVVYRQEFNGNYSGTHNMELNLPQLTSGMYFINIAADNGSSASEKFNIQ